MAATPHALLTPEYHRRIAAMVTRPRLRAVPQVDELTFDELTVGDIVRHAGEDHAVVEINHADGWMVLMDERDHCDGVHDCAAETWHRVEIGF